MSADVQREDVTAAEREPSGCRYCGIKPGQDLPRPSYHDMRRELEWAVGLLREIRLAGPPAWWDGLCEFLDAQDAEVTDG